MQQAYLQLTTGVKVAVVSYAQADGSRTVTYPQANLVDLTAAIPSVKSAIERRQTVAAHSMREPGMKRLVACGADALLTGFSPASHADLADDASDYVGYTIITPKTHSVASVGNQRVTRLLQ